MKDTQVLEGKKGEEETYSVIFTSLKHPIRRKILRMLTDKPMTFSEILEILSIDSGHLSYHIENLGELITHSPYGKYELSSVGVAAVKLMSGVEEQPRPFVSSRTKETLTGDVTKIYTLFLAISLVIASIYFMNFITVEQPSSIRVAQGAPKTILPNQPYHYNLTIIYSEASLQEVNLTAIDITSGYNFSFTIMNTRMVEDLGCCLTMIHRKPEVTRYEENGIYMERHAPINTLTSWTQCHFFFGLEANETYDLTIKVYDPEGTILSKQRECGDSVHIEGVGLGEITQEGTYLAEFCNNNSTPTSAFIMARVVWTRFRKPYFYPGLIALVITFSYPTFLLINKLAERETKGERECCT